MAVSCDLVASPTGSDSAAGTAAEPLRSAQRLVDSLQPGQTGCLRAGTYDTDAEIKLSVPGITLTAYPGEQATLRGRLWVADGSTGSTVSGLNLDGRNDRDLPSPTINGDDVVLSGNDITNHHTSICLSIGSLDTYGRAQNTLVEDNRIHDCGVLPATNYDHGIYVAAADDTVIRGNWIYDNADRGVQLYPDAQRTLVTGNVIDGNGSGVIFSGGEGTASSDNVVEHNVITNSRVRDNVESYWGNGPVGNGNVVRENCIGGDGGGPPPEGSPPMRGFEAYSNEDPTAGGSLCAGLERSLSP
ncbi:MAG: right-handed parallel beta-helix repeat-containing protein [Solirubrobacterales bacterium]